VFLLFYLITYTPKCFVIAVSAVGAKLKSNIAQQNP